MTEFSKFMTMLCVLLLATASMQAQSMVDNGDDPPEPMMKYKIKVQAASSDACYVGGAGQYVTGTNVYISSSAKSTDFTFSHWTMNGERINQPSSFNYTVNSDNVTFVAYYTFTPEDPVEPVVDNRRRLFLVSMPEDASSFNRASGTKVDYDSYVLLTVYPSQEYVFKGWYDGETKICDDVSFNYCMPDRDVTLTAKFKYEPEDPSEPESSGNVQVTQLGDANTDGSVDITDVVDVINAYLTNNNANISVGAADLDRDGVIDITDAVGIINKYLNDN